MVKPKVPRGATRSARFPHYAYRETGIRLNVLVGNATVVRAVWEILGPLHKDPLATPHLYSARECEAYLVATLRAMANRR